MLESLLILFSPIVIQFEQDSVLVPKETSWFGYYADGSFDTLLPAQQVVLPTF